MKTKTYLTEQFWLEVAFTEDGKLAGVSGHKVKVELLEMGVIMVDHPTTGTQFIEADEYRRTTLEFGHEEVECYELLF